MYNITREELLDMIEAATSHGERRVLEKHLQVFDGRVTDCESCHIEDIEEDCEDECEIGED